MFGQVQIQGAYSGFMDRFIKWYHSLLGVEYIAREIRPLNKYEYSITYERGKTIRYGPVDLGIGDSRIGIGRMLGQHAQVLLVLGLPTSTAPGYRAGTLQTGLILTGEAPLLPFATVSGSIGVGFTPRTGTLAAYENVFFMSFSGGPRIKLSWRNFLYGNLFVQTPPFHGTGLRPMDDVDFTIDFGWMYRDRPAHRAVGRHRRGSVPGRPGARRGVPDRVQDLVLNGRLGAGTSLSPVRVGAVPRPRARASSTASRRG